MSNAVGIAAALASAALVSSEGGVVLDPPDVARIMELKRQGWGSKRIAQELGVARGTVRRYLRLGRYEPYRRESPARELAPHLEWMKERLAAVRGNVRVLHRELRERGVEAGYSTVARAMSVYRAELAAQARATVRFETAPGEQMQVDFGELRLEIAGVQTKVHLCVTTLGYSRRTHVRAFLAERQEHWLAAMESAFAHFGGVPAELLVDNARALVAEHDWKRGRVRFSEAFEAFCELHGTRPKACRPLRARTKGKVESGVKYVKRNALAGRAFASFAELENWLIEWTRDIADVREHGTTHERPIDRFEAEEAALKPYRHVKPVPLPQKRKVSADCFVDVDTNRYSVPHRLVGRTVEVVIEDGHVLVRSDGVEVARHVQVRGRHRVSLVAAHTEGLWRTRATLVADEPVERPLAVYEEVADANAAA